MSARRARITDGGRLIIPAGLRRQLGLRTGDTVVMEVADGELRVRSMAAAAARAQAIIRKYATSTEGAVEELIRDRREEAARE